MSNKNLFAALSSSFEIHGDRLAFELPGLELPGLELPDGELTQDTSQISYAQLGNLTQRMAQVLLEVGVESEQRVLVQVGKSVPAVALYLACLQVGAVYVPINTAYTAGEVEYFLGDAEPTLFVCEPRDEEAFSALAKCRVRSLGLAGDGSFGAAATQATLSENAMPVAAKKSTDVAAILYTSGTTGRSKGAMLSHGNLLSNAEVLLDYWDWQDSDVLLHTLPIFHVHGLFVALHCALLSGTPMLFMPAFDAAQVLPLLARATVMMGVPTFYSRLLTLPEFDRSTCANMRLFISGSAPLTEQTFNEFEDRTGQRILERYGMSETLMNTSNPLSGQRVAGTVGFALPGVTARIANEEGQELMAGDVGVIEVKGPNLFQGYWRMPQKTAEEFRKDGFFITGDLGTMDLEGRVTIVGREKDLVISGGYNVYPKEVERLLDEMPGIQESAVIGVPHADFGEVVVAVVVPTGDPVDHADLRTALEDSLARYKQPKAVFNVAELPRNAMGKVQKAELRALHAKLFAS